MFNHDYFFKGYYWNKGQIHRDNGNVDANFAKLQVDENGKIALSEVERLSNPNTMNKNFLGKVRAEYSAKGLKGEALENAVKAEKARIQVHHLIPDEVVRNSEFGKAAQKAGYNLDEGTNLLGLPRKAENIKAGETGHWTNHPEYSKYVTNKLKEAKIELELKYKKPIEQIDKKIILNEMKRLEKEFQDYIKSGKALKRPDGSLAKLDTQENKTLTLGGRYEARV
jgi:A nuclease family of the HNH/ENDO VII superfamily with conserved AHH